MTTITITRYHGPQPDGWDQFLSALPHHVAQALMVWRRDEDPEITKVVLDRQGVHTDRRIDLMINVNWPGSDASIRTMCEQDLQRRIGDYMEACGLDVTVRLARAGHIQPPSFQILTTSFGAQDLDACFLPHAVAGPGYEPRDPQATPAGKDGTMVVDQSYHFLLPPPEDEQDRFNRQIRAWRGEASSVSWR